MALTTVSDAEILAKVKSALGIGGDYQNDTLSIYISDVKDFMIAGGVSTNVVNSTLAVGAICRGVSDIWNYGSGNTEFSLYFKQRVTQLAFMKVEESGGE